MKATLRTTLGWIAAVLVNVGAVTFVFGLVLPRVNGGEPLFVSGIALCVAGLAAAAGWALASRRPRP